MSLLPTTELESHPDGTTGVAGIINGNWERLEEMFVALGSASPTDLVSWDATAKAFTTSPGGAVGGGPLDGFKTLTNEDGGQDLAVWNQDQGIFQRIRITGLPGFEQIVTVS